MINFESEIMDIGWMEGGGYFIKLDSEKYENEEKGSRKALSWSVTFIFQFWLNWHFPPVLVLAFQRFDQVDDCVCQRSPKITFSNARLNFKGHSTPRQRQYRVFFTSLFQKCSSDSWNNSCSQHNYFVFGLDFMLKSNHRWREYLIWGR